jgi:serine protease AprX
MSQRFKILPFAALLGLAVTCGARQAGALPRAGAEPQKQGYIVEAAAAADAARAVHRVGGVVTHALPIVNGVSAELTPAQAGLLRKLPGLVLFADTTVATQSAGTNSTVPDIYQRAMLGVNELASQGINGVGVTVAVIDSGILQKTTSSFLTADLAGHNRMVAQYDAIKNVLVDAAHPCANYPCVNDGYGHGSHITSLIASSNTADPTLQGEPQGIAPMVHLISVKAFDDTGTGSYATVLNGINWILAHRTTYGAIRVVNMSFGAKPQSFYWNDPIDQAVMKLWQAGIVVVASAGNFGPTPQSIAVPGNTPYVITVGAMTDNFTPNDPTDDGVTSFSSAGPTYEGFVKPDVVAPGGHLAAFMDVKNQVLPLKYPQFGSDSGYMFIMSGTSQAAAVTSGVVALMLQADPALTPDQVKCRLLASADAAIGKGGKAAYTVFQQGAGRVNAYGAVYSQASNCANLGLNVAFDIAGLAHFGGPAHQNRATGAFYVANEFGLPVNNDGYLWNQSFAKSEGYLWNQGYLWNNGYLWNQGYLWSNGFLWNQGYLWNNGYLWNQNSVAPAGTPTAMESWNAQE